MGMRWLEIGYWNKDQYKKKPVKKCKKHKFIVHNKTLEGLCIKCGKLESEIRKEERW